MADPYWDNVVLALPMNDPVGSTTFTDLKGHTVSRAGNTVIATTPTGPAAYFDGAGDRLYSTSHDFALGTGAFTQDFFLRPTGTRSGRYARIVQMGDNNVAGGFWFVRDLVTSPMNFIMEGYSGAYIRLSPVINAGVANDTRVHIAICRTEEGIFLIFVGGVLMATGPDYPAYALTQTTISIGSNTANAESLQAYIDSYRVTEGVCRWTTDFTPPAPYFEDAPVRVLAILDQSWGDNPIVSAELHQPWGIKTGADLVQPSGDAPVIRAELYQPSGDAPVVRAELLQRWLSSFTQRAQLRQEWHIFGVVVGELKQWWAITSDLVRAELLQSWDLRERDLLRAELVQRWAIEADSLDVAGSTGGQLPDRWDLDADGHAGAVTDSLGVLRYRLSVQSDGADIGVTHLNIEAGLDGDVISCEIQVGTEDDYLRCPLGATLTVSLATVDGEDAFVFVVIAPRITEAHGDTQYIIEAMSPGVLLGEPYAAPVEGELSGLASAIAVSLAGDVPLAWNTVDWEIPPATWIAAGETLLALLKTLAAAVGAVVQSLPDGSLTIEPEYPLSVDRWATATPGLTLVENLDCFTTGSTPELKSGYNKFLIGDQLSSADTLRLEEEAVSKRVKLARGYQTPWAGDFDLTHTGGDWVTIEPLGVEERQITETVEIVAGAGRVQYPIYSRDAVAWEQVNLGSVAVSEDGSLTTSVDKESLLTLTYTTRCKLWRVTDAQNEQLQLVAP